MNKNSIPELTNPSIIERVGEECVVLPNNVTEDCLVGLANETAAFILERIDGQTSIDEIANSLCETYEIDKPTAINVAFDFVVTLQENGVCRWKKEN